MNAPCARCKKTVYPVEKLNCLDKVWHKGCFTCNVCNLKLTMKTYKGYNKEPYCQPHYPTTKHTAVADTPENKRLAKQTANQSNIVYHKDHQQNLAKFSQVADTPAMETSKRNQLNASQINYTQKAPTAVPQNPSPGQQYMEPEDYNPEQELESVQPSGGYEPPPQPAAQAPPAASGPRYMALYDYTAADDDEVSFMEGDKIVNVTVIDDGWMEGMVERTGQHGMLPSNYVEAC
ncbi:LIM and SH3 domain protein 1-like isoform X2 [Acanthaster planci]|uniref:LIM and SH3 domain protein 1-like isoform X2 n=1 Tax=Acanthaster planci TaxID=133434 RepID=A0A8B7Y5B1_ACAPL|nr:LIM and SH3 domain protein 1-like isoform X2 [Acanthaster planci]